MKTLQTEPTDGLDTPAIVAAGLAATIGTFALIVAIQVAFAWLLPKAAAQSASKGSDASAGILADQRAKMQRYGWLDREQGRVTIPIDQAIDLIVREHSISQPPTSSGVPRGESGAGEG
jgi:hypothetical protein